MTPEIEQDLFNRNLLLTQTYCDLQLQKPFENNVKVLRSINPEINGEPVFSFGMETYKEFKWNKTNWNSDPFRVNNWLYNNLYDEQTRVKEQLADKVRASVTYHGKILIVLVDETLTDGASEAETDGFIDVYDCPPIDTWFYKTFCDEGMMIFSWIPAQFVGIVENGIAVNATEPFYWYNNDSVFTNSFRYNEPTLAQTAIVKSPSIIKRILNFFRMSK